MRFSTLACGTMIYSFLWVCSRDCPIGSLCVILSLASGDFLLPAILSTQLKTGRGGLRFFRAQAPCSSLHLSPVFLQTPASWASWDSHLHLLNAGRPQSSIWIFFLCTAAWPLMSVVTWGNWKSYFIHDLSWGILVLFPDVQSLKTVLSHVFL